MLWGSGPQRGARWDSAGGCGGSRPGWGSFGRRTELRGPAALGDRDRAGGRARGEGASRSEAAPWKVGVISPASRRENRGWKGEVTRGSCSLLRPSPHSRDWGWSSLIGQSWGAGREDLSRLDSSSPPAPVLPLEEETGLQTLAGGEGSPLPGLGVALLKLLTAQALPGSVRTPHLPPASGRQAPLPGTPILLPPQFSKNRQLS